MNFKQYKILFVSGAFTIIIVLSNTISTNW